MIGKEIVLVYKVAIANAWEIPKNTQEQIFYFQ